MSKRAKKPTRKNLATTRSTPDKLPLIEHLHELRRRAFYVAVSVAVGAALAYGFERKLIDFLLRPSHGQNFIYTSPLGGINFLFGVCLDVGLVLSTPIIIYQLLAFLQPLMKQTTRRFLVISAGAAGTVAIGGVMFGYFIGLPAALHFLLHQFVTVQVRPLITVQSYMSFVSLYLFGSALMFQLPLILLFINRIKPLKPSGLLKYERHLVVFAFVAAFIMNPTPNIIDQMVVVVPIIAMYQIGILAIWFVNRKAKRGKYRSLFARDAAAQAERLKQSLQAQPLQIDARESESILKPFAQPALAPVPMPADEPSEVPQASYTGSPALSFNRRPFFNDYGSRNTSYSRLLQ